jgi:hypothetical protein
MQFKDVVAPTYRELKKKLPELAAQSIDGIVTVVRTRRGEWGQWFEKYELVKGKLKHVKSTWL